MRKYHMNCACEHGQPCTRVAACFVEEIVGDLAREIEMKAEDDHAALIAKVREIAEDIPHEESCSLHAMSKALRSALGLTANKCTCPRGKLLALCEVK